MNLRIEQSDREYNILKKQRKISLLQLKVLEDEYEMLKKQEKKREEYMNQPYLTDHHHPPPPLKHIKNSHTEPPPPHFPPPRPVYIPYNNHQMSVKSPLLTIPLSNSHREREFPDEREKLSPPLRISTSQQRGTSSNIPVNNHGKRTETTDYRSTTPNIKQSSPHRLTQSTYKQTFYRNNKASSPSRKYKSRYSPNRDKKNKDITTTNGDKGKSYIYICICI